MKYIPDRKDREQAIDAAVNWWCDVITHPRFDCGDKSETGATMNLLGTILSSKNRITPEQIERYKPLLKESINTQWEREGGKLIVVASDYGPDYTLLVPAQTVGIDECVFPWKTTMWIYIDAVKVSGGRDAGIEVIWKALPDSTSRPDKIEVNEQEEPR